MAFDNADDLGMFIHEVSQFGKAFMVQGLDFSLVRIKINHNLHHFRNRLLVALLNDLGNLAGFFHFRMRSNLDLRITSYNVCYTKLLRFD